MLFSINNHFANEDELRGRCNSVNPRIIYRLLCRKCVRKTVHCSAFRLAYADSDIFKTLVKTE